MPISLISVMDIIIIFFSFLFPFVYSEVEPCSIAKCGQNEISIRFPFRLEGKQPENCGYPGFNLGCKSPSNNIVLKFPYSGEFFVREINYPNQQVSVYDPDNCLPKRLLSFNLSGSPFVSPFQRNYTFLNCPAQVTKSRFITIDCLSNSTNSVLATSSTSLVNSMASSCRVIAALQIPVSWPAQFDESFSADLGGDLKLTWYSPQCGDCEEEGGVCGFNSNGSEETHCFHLPKSGRSSDGLQVFRIICLSIAIPALTGTIGIAVFACYMDSRRQARENSARRSAGPSAVSPQPAAVVTGLDESTIESYQKLELGESRRIPGPNDSTCPICLSEYLSKDTIRSIPECKHCFHADCIDEWLRMNTTCPVCRNSPSPEAVTSRTGII